MPHASSKASFAKHKVAQFSELHFRKHSLIYQLFSFLVSVILYKRIQNTWTPVHVILLKITMLAISLQLPVWKKHCMTKIIYIIVKPIKCQG